MKKKRPSNERIAIIVLIVLLIIATAYSAYGDFVKAEAVKDMAVYQQGFQAGYEQAVVKMFEEAMGCEPVPLFIGKLNNQIVNKTINVINVECVRQAPAAGV